MLGRRENPGEHEAMRKMKNEFMVNWDGLRTKVKDCVLVLGATNRPFDLDEAVIRRLPRRLMVNLPDSTNREKILKNLCVTAAHCPIREILEKEKEAAKSRVPSNGDNDCLEYIGDEPNCTLHTSDLNPDPDNLDSPSFSNTVSRDAPSFSNTVR